jgi:hypothetical protein
MSPLIPLSRRARLVAVLTPLAVLAASAVAIAPASAASTEWHVPRCGDVVGAPVSFTWSDGAELAKAPHPVPVTYTHVAALAETNTLLAATSQSILRSTDAGCTWQELAAPGFLAQYDVAAAGDVAYIYGINNQPIYRVSGTDVTEVSGPVLGDGSAGFAVDPTDPNHLVAVDKTGQVFESSDGGAAWTATGTPAGGTGRFAYDAAIDPANLSHVVVGTLSHGTWVSFDGGMTWQASAGFGVPGRANGFSVAVSPADPETVWAEGYDLTQSGNGARQIWLSRDGGLSFVSVLDGNQVTLFNGTPLWPSPADADVLYFDFGTSFGGYGTDIYKYNAATQRITVNHNSYDDVSSIVFNPANPQLMYLGLVEER